MQPTLKRYSSLLVVTALTSVVILTLFVRPAEAQLDLMSAKVVSSNVVEDPLICEVPNAAGIREAIPAKYLKRYAGWKREFLSTDMGRSQWEKFARHQHLTLTITISSNKEHNGETGEFKWDNSGHLVAATITLGSRIDEGYPTPANYPVLSSLAPRGPSPYVRGKTLAAAKIAHEFGHLNRMTVRDRSLFQLQTELTPIYNSILLSNGHNVHDPRLVELEKLMGGTPAEVWQDNEHRAEANALLFLADRYKEAGFLCSLFNRIRENIRFYLDSHAEHLIRINESNSTLARCGPPQRLVAKQ